MRGRVTRAFIDRFTSHPYNVGDIYETGDKGRYEQLADMGYVEKVEFKEDDKVEEPKRRSKAAVKSDEPVS